MDFISNLLASPFICLGWIIIGALAGSISRNLMKSTDMPFWSDVLLGIVGAFVGGLLAGLLGLAPQAGTAGLELVFVNLVIATIGAMILIGLRRVLLRG